MVEQLEAVWLKGSSSILQSKDFFKLTQDTVLLADFVRMHKGELALDLGAGVGCLGILVLLCQPGRVDGIELTPGAAALARDNYIRCSLEDRGTVTTGDFGALPPALVGRYDVCLSNPPYFSGGLRAKDAALATARHGEGENSLSLVCRGAAKALKSGGRFYVCVPPQRLNHLWAAMGENRLVPKTLRLVHHRQDRDAILALVEARYDRNCQLQVMPPLIVWEGEAHSPEYSRIYGKAP